jgi:aromatic amino acid aminotransferase I
LSKERRVAIYKIAQKHDFIIIEDEPYYFLQMPEYTTDVSQRKSEAQTHEEFVDSLVPSFISLDVDGRVLRLDSFSKVLGPGLRFGWVIGQPTLLERILRLHEVSVQAPAGLTQSIVNGLLQRWGQEGYLDWLIGLRAEYTIRRDATIDAVEKYFPKEISHYNPPVAGMFFTISFDASKHPKFATEYDSDPLKVEAALFDQSVKEGALLIPGSWFKTCGQTNPPQPEVDAKPGSENTIFFRGTYAAVSLEKIDLGLENFSKAVKVQFGL